MNKIITDTSKEFFVVRFIPVIGKNGEPKVSVNGECKMDYEIIFKSSNPEECKKYAENEELTMVTDENGLDMMNKYCSMHKIYMGSVERFIVKNREAYENYNRDTIELCDAETRVVKANVDCEIGGFINNKFSDEEWYHLTEKIVRSEWGKAYAYKIKNLSTPIDLTHDFYLYCWENDVFKKYNPVSGVSRYTYLRSVFFRHYSNVDKSKDVEMMSNVFSSVELAEKDMLKSFNEQLSIASVNESDLANDIFNSLSELTSNSKFVNAVYGCLNPYNLIKYIYDNPNEKLKSIAETFVSDIGKKASVQMISHNLVKAREHLLSDENLRYRFCSRFDWKRVSPK